MYTIARGDIFKTYNDYEPTFDGVWVIWNHSDTVDQGTFDDNGDWTPTEVKQVVAIVEADYHDVNRVYEVVSAVGDETRFRYDDTTGRNVITVTDETYGHIFNIVFSQRQVIKDTEGRSA